MRLFKLMLCGFLCVGLLGCKKSTNDDAVKADVISVSDNSVDKFVTISLDDEVDNTETTVSDEDVYVKGVVDLPDIEADYYTKISAYRNYDTGTNEVLGRNDDGTISFAMSDVNFLYNCGIDIQLLSANNDTFYVKSMDGSDSYFGVAIYTGSDYDNAYDLIKTGGYGVFDQNGNMCYMAQNQDNTIWYYAFKDVSDTKLVVIEHVGNFVMNDLTVYLDLPDVYSVKYQ